MHKVGRNDPCPCGSGKKFKKCCEAKEHRCTFKATVLTQETKVGHLSARFFPKPPPAEPPHPPQDL